MKKTIILFLSIFIISCSVVKRTDYSNAFWGELESKEAYLYLTNSLTSIVDKEIKEGTILYFYKERGEFYEVYTKNPRLNKDQSVRQNYKFYLHKPKYRKLRYKYEKDIATVYEIPFDPNQNYISGERGGCYYINKYSNKTYVNRSYCKDRISKNRATYKTKTPKSTIRKSSSVQCLGRTKKGNRCKNKTTSSSGRCHLH